MSHFFLSEGQHNQTPLVRRAHPERQSMQFVLLIHQGTTPTPTSPTWSTLSETEQQQIYADYAAFNAIECMTAGLPLGLPDDASTVTVRDGVRTVAPGNYLQDPTKAVGGYCVVEADDIEIAYEIAAKSRPPDSVVQSKYGPSRPTRKAPNETRGRCRYCATE